MLTVRGWWLLIAVLALLVVGLHTGVVSVILMSFTLLAWLLAGWLIFALKVRWLQATWRVERELRDTRGPVRSLWTGQKTQVVVRLRSDSRFGLPFVHVADRLPALARHIEGENRASASLAGPVEVAYVVECVAAGKLRFEGLHVQVADVQGFFQQTMFVREVKIFPVYPMLAGRRSQIPTLKHHNVLSILGTHRHRRPGSGSELLDLRDYLPGDPPKTIAWKASARRDRLMTKEFESEVPVRCTLLVDVSSSVRVGRLGENPLARLVEIAAAVVQASASVKDLTGLCLFEEQGIRKMIRPKRGTRHVLAMMSALAQVADLPLSTDQVSLETLLPLAFGLAQEVYPDLLEADVNRMPFWLPWWAPQPAYTRELPPRPPGGLLARLMKTLRRGFRTWENALAGRSPARRRQYRWRKQLAAIMSVRHGLGPGGLAWLLEDDQACKRHLQRFLAEHQVAFAMPLYDAYGRFLFAVPEKMDVLARALLTCVTRGRDNELFVLLVDLLEIGPRLDRLLRAVQVARARHHRVMVICPWPREVPVPGRLQQAVSATEAPAESLQDLFFHASTARLQQAGRHVQRSLARLGVPVLFSPESKAVPMILEEMRLLRLRERGGP